MFKITIWFLDPTTYESYYLTKYICTINTDFII